MPVNGQHDQVIVFTLPKKPVSRGQKRMRRGRLPRVSRLMALAIRFEGLLQEGAVRDFADLARLGRVTRARISQIMNLLNLAPDLQERLLFLAPALTRQEEIHERTLRAVVRESSWKRQRRLFAAVEPRCAASRPSGAE
jgi:hypothetical protein